jgi:diguanylate cyclase (GGDEF)-like protein
VRVAVRNSSPPGQPHLTGGVVVAENVAGALSDRRRPLLVLVVIVLVGSGVGAFLQTRHAPGAGGELWFLATLVVAAGVFALVITDPSGGILVISPTVCFSFAILLLWGLVPAIAAQVAGVAAVMWRRRLPPLGVLLVCVQVVVAFAAAYAVLSLGRRPMGLVGRAWANPNDAAGLILAIAVYIAVFAAFDYLLAWVTRRYPKAGLARPTRYKLLFSAALVLLSPAIAVTAQHNIAFVPFVVAPLYSMQQMARLTAERDRASRLDPLTSLANRAMLRDRFNQLAAVRDRPTSQSSPRRLAFMLLDLDRFKRVNDSLGYEVGDRLLIAVADRLRTFDTGGGLVGRLGGDEFAVLARVPDADAAGDLAVRVLTLLREPATLDGLDVDVTASVGVALRPDNAADDFVAVFRHADAAMYEAKRRGDAVAIYQDQAAQDTLEPLHLLADFRKAIQARDSTEITMHYQPQSRLDNGAIEGLEALLRWTHPVHGQVDAGTIVEIAEQTSVIHLLTKRVIDDVTAQMARWRSDDLTPRVSINISARDLYREDIIDHLAGRLDHHHLPPNQLQVEITESALMVDPARAHITLRRIVELGVGISLDDFGTGYSSLQHLRWLPLAELKIDKTFVAGIAHNHDDASIVASTIELAHALGFRTVAEGVADQPTRRLLTDLDCDLAQGWHIAHAVPADHIRPLILGSLIAAGGTSD